jgi:hypothetical protein
MRDFDDAMAVWTYGAGGALPDGTRTPETLPDGTLPVYSTDAAAIHGTTIGGLQQEIPFAADGTDLGFGSDLVCWDDFDEQFTECDPTSPYAVAQDAYHRLNTQRGLIIDDPDYGKDVKGMLQRAFGPNGRIETEGQLRGELLKDNRIDPATLKVVVTVDATGRAIDMSVNGFCAKGPFALVMRASDAGVLLKSIQGDT